MNFAAVTLQLDHLCNLNVCVKKAKFASKEKGDDEYNDSDLDMPDNDGWDGGEENGKRINSIRNLWVLHQLSFVERTTLPRKKDNDSNEVETLGTSETWLRNTKSSLTSIAELGTSEVQITSTSFIDT